MSSYSNLLSCLNILFHAQSHYQIFTFRLKSELPEKSKLKKMRNFSEKKDIKLLQTFKET